LPIVAVFLQHIMLLLKMMI